MARGLGGSHYHPEALRPGFPWFAVLVLLAFLVVFLGGVLIGRDSVQRERCVITYGDAP